jgi:hypothetical protein
MAQKVQCEANIYRIKIVFFYALQSAFPLVALRTAIIILRHPLGLDGLLTASSYQPPHPPTCSPPAPHPGSPESTVLY